LQEVLLKLVEEFVTERILMIHLQHQYREELIMMKLSFVIEHLLMIQQNLLYFEQHQFL
jgi:hypothetical protein